MIRAWIAVVCASLCVVTAFAGKPYSKQSWHKRHAHKGTLLPSIKAKVMAMPVSLSVDAGADQFECTGSVVVLGSKPLIRGGVAPFNIEWFPSAGLSNASDPNPFFRLQQTQLYTVTVTDAQGVSVSASVTIHALPKPNADAGEDILSCKNSVVQIGAESVAGNTYMWFPQTGLSSAFISNPLLTVDDSRDYIVKVQNELGCISYDTVHVEQQELPIPRFAGTSSICSGETVLYAVIPDSTRKAEYTWNAYNAGAELLSGQGTNAIVTKFNSSGVGVVELSMRVLSNGCSAYGVHNQEVTTLPTPKIVYNGATSFCSGKSLRLSVDSIYISYRWSNGATGSFLDVTSSGWYNVAVFDSKGCKGKSDSVFISVHEPLAMNISGSTQFCEGESTMLTAELPCETYTWSTGENSRSISVTRDGVYSVTGLTSEGCSATESIEVSTFTSSKFESITTIFPTEQLGEVRSRYITLFNPYNVELKVESMKVTENAEKYSVVYKSGLVIPSHGIDSALVVFSSNTAGLDTGLIQINYSEPCALQQSIKLRAVTEEPVVFMHTELTPNKEVFQIGEKSAELTVWASATGFVGNAVQNADWNGVIKFDSRVFFPTTVSGVQEVRRWFNEDTVYIECKKSLVDVYESKTELGKIEGVPLLSHNKETSVVFSANNWANIPYSVVSSTKNGNVRVAPVCVDNLRTLTFFELTTIRSISSQTHGDIRVTINAGTEGTYRIELISLTGALVTETSKQLNKSDAENFVFSCDWCSAGTYMIRLTTPMNEVLIEKIQLVR